MKRKIDMEYIINKITTKNIPISEIAEKTGYSRAAVYRYIKKERVPNIDFVNKLLELIE